MSSSVLITSEYRKLNQELHHRDQTWGSASASLELIRRAIAWYRVKTVLDYGCGKGELPRYLSGVRIQLYDPAMPQFAHPPEPADMVHCAAVLEHVEFMSLIPVLNDLERLTKKVALITVSTVESSKILADGRNAHLMVKPIDWWITGLAQRWTMKAAENMGTWFWFLGKKKVNGQ